MADMFGAAAGISQAHADQRMQALAQMQELELQGKVAMQPTQKAFMESQTRENVAQAAEREANAEQTLGIGNIAKGFRADEAMGRLGGVQGQPAPGQPGGASPQVMQMSPGQRMMGLATRVADQYPIAGMKMLNEASQIVSHEASAQNANAEAEKRKLEKQLTITKMIGSAAGSVFDQSSYERVIAAGIGYGFDTSKLPQTYAEFAATNPKTGMSIQHSLLMNGMTAMEQTKSKLDALDAERKKLNDVSSISLKNSKAAMFSAQEKLATQKYNAFLKNGGPDSPVTQAAKQAMIESRERKNVADYEKTYFLIPADKKALVVGRKYRTPDGRHGVWDGASMQPLQVTPPTMQTRAQQGAQARTEALAAMPAEAVDTSLDEED
jgi:hypothetical protein